MASRGGCDQRGAGKGEYLVALDLVGADRGQLVLTDAGQLLPLDARDRGSADGHAGGGDRGHDRRGRGGELPGGAVGGWGTWRERRDTTDRCGGAEELPVRGDAGCGRGQPRAAVRCWGDGAGDLCRCGLGSVGGRGRAAGAGGAAAGEAAGADRGDAGGGACVPTNRFPRRRWPRRGWETCATSRRRTPLRPRRPPGWRTWSRRPTPTSTG